jgi:hypothetical protein
MRCRSHTGAIAEWKSELDRDAEGDARDLILDLLERPQKAFRIETKGNATGTRKIAVCLQPSNRFAMLLSTLRAWDIDGVVIEKA